ASSVHFSITGGIGSHYFENEAVLSSFSSMSAPELHIPESSNVLKEPRGFDSQSGDLKGASAPQAVFVESSLIHVSVRLSSYLISDDLSVGLLCHLGVDKLRVVTCVSLFFALTQSSHYTRSGPQLEMTQGPAGERHVLRAAHEHERTALSAWILFNKSDCALDVHLRAELSRLSLGLREWDDLTLIVTEIEIDNLL
ncbi:hypothetical protein Tco_0841792, partial [Tanacetum coccineum]